MMPASLLWSQFKIKHLHILGPPNDHSLDLDPTFNLTPKFLNDVFGFIPNRPSLYWPPDSSLPSTQINGPFEKAAENIVEDDYVNYLRSLNKF